jgi:hypothetical protein
MHRTTRWEGGSRHSEGIPKWGGSQSRMHNTNICVNLALIGRGGDRVDSNTLQ